MSSGGSLANRSGGRQWRRRAVVGVVWWMYKRMQAVDSQAVQAVDGQDVRLRPLA